MRHFVRTSLLVAGLCACGSDDRAAESPVNQTPRDADGDVAPRMPASGDDLSKPRDIESDQVDPVPLPAEHAVIVHLKLSDSTFGASDERDSIHELTARMEQRIADAGYGEFDGDEFGGGECTLYMYGADADRLFAAVERELRASPHARGGFVIKRYGAAGDPSAREVRVDL